MNTKRKYYIGQRDNPQLKKPYYVAYGMLTKKEAARKENCIYGSITCTSYDTEESYNYAIAKLENEGFTVCYN